VLEQEQLMTRLSDAGVERDLAGEALRVVAAVLERGERALEHHTLLRVGPLRLARRQPEQLVVHRVDQPRVEHRPRRHERRVVRHRRRQKRRGLQLVSREAPDRLDAAANVIPERRDVGRTRKAPRHPDDRDLGAGQLALAHRYLRPLAQR
jgi:hypothetical protein